jgi:hypothetical protein
MTVVNTLLVPATTLKTDALFWTISVGTTGLTSTFRYANTVNALLTIWTVLVALTSRVRCAALLSAETLCVGSLSCFITVYILYACNRFALFFNAASAIHCETASF